MNVKTAWYFKWQPSNEYFNLTFSTQSLTPMGLINKLTRPLYKESRVARITKRQHDKMITFGHKTCIKTRYQKENEAKGGKIPLFYF